uniref:Uncharacterized protein n=1 Tax=Trypanosoma congolense (strain IL3000) TaxID=1068625 RepID=G0UNZ0_TRYCI|nr:conserved hypothetical protein [Trypanosoma congolense IL3000]
MTTLYPRALVYTRDVVQYSFVFLSLLQSSNSTISSPLPLHCFTLSHWEEKVIAAVARCTTPKIIRKARVMPSIVKRPLWSYFVPTTWASKLHRVSYHAPLLMFGVSAFALVARQSYYRGALADEDDKTCDRIDRRAYVALPDGRMALVYPIVDTQLTPTRALLALFDMINPMP